MRSPCSPSTRPRSPDASPARIADRFEGVPFRLGWADAPLIDGAVAWFECRHFSRQPTGDHTLFVGEVVRCARAQGPGLVFHHGRFGTVAPTGA